ncbi:MAG TPA: T9SS type A sorting domain-containing protein, partial [Saprospiraceae bacterium]
LILSPNPVSTELQLSGMPLDDATITIFNATGNLMSSRVLNDNTLDVSGLLPGLYLLRIKKDGLLLVKRFIKE